MPPYIIKTSGEGEPLIVLHGWGMNSSVWESIRPALASQYKVSWIDLPGHGDNYAVKANSMDDIVDHILPFIPDDAHLLGWSLGGLVAQAVAEKMNHNSKKLKSITLVASTLRFSQAEAWQHAMSFDVLNNFASSLQNDLTGTLKRFVALQFMGVKETKAIQQNLIRGVLSALPRTSALELGLQLLTQSDFRQSRHHYPQHWIMGGKDRLIPKDVINDLKLLRPNDQITLLDKAGHAPFMTHPEEFIDSLNAFITKHA